MRSLPGPLLGHYQSGSTSLAYCVLVTRTDGQIFGFTSTDQPLVIAGQRYETGLDVKSIAQSAGLAVNNLEVVALYQGPFAKPDFLAGRWSGARWELFETSWIDPSIGSNTIGRYVTGNCSPGSLSCTIELRALSQYLQQPIGLVTSKTCRARFADYPSQILNARCGIAAATYIVPGSVTAVVSQSIIEDSASSGAYADDWFAEGLLRFTSGDNVGLGRKVKTYQSATYSFSQAFPFTILPGDTFEVIAGCRKRLTEDCLGKFDNVLNFQGEPHLPGVDQQTASPITDAS